MPDHERSQNLAEPFLLFAQHGWADTAQRVREMAESLSPQNPLIYAPDLGWWKTWYRIEPLIDVAEQVAAQAIAKHPDRPLRIIGHSMGGLIWLELLDRHREWWSRVHSLVLIGSPVGGSDLARLLDPFSQLPAIARDLGQNRRLLAEAIAAAIPTASIASDIGGYSDGTVPVNSSEFTHATQIYLQAIPHARLNCHPEVAAAIERFWQQPVVAPRLGDRASQLISQLRSLNLTECSHQNFPKARLVKAEAEGVKVWRWKNPLRMQHVFISRPCHLGNGDRCCYAAYVSWLDDRHLSRFFQQL